MKPRSLSVILACSVVLGGCGAGGDEETTRVSLTATSETTTSSEPTTTTTVETTTTTFPLAPYCDAIKTAFPLRDINSEQGTGTDKGKAARYAAALEKVVAASPPADRKLWDISLRIAQAFAQGVDPSNDDIRAGLDELGPVAIRVERSCGIDIT